MVPTRMTARIQRANGTVSEPPGYDRHKQAGLLQLLKGQVSVEEFEASQAVANPSQPIAVSPAPVEVSTLSSKDQKFLEAWDMKDEASRRRQLKRITDVKMLHLLISHEMNPQWLEEIGQAIARLGR